MKLTFLGANHEVTGSCTMLEAAGQRFLIDYGMEQGTRRSSLSVDMMILNMQDRRSELEWSSICSSRSQKRR